MTGVYKITNKINNKFYIGSSTNISKRFRQHRYNGSIKSKHNTELYGDMYNFGIDNFIFEVLEETNIDDMRVVEQKYMNQYKPDYNKQKYTENVMDKKEVKDKHTKILMSEGYKNKIKATRGFTQTDDFKKKISQSSKRYSRDNYEKICLKSKQAQSSLEYREKRRKIALEPEFYKNNILSQKTRIEVEMFDFDGNKINEFLSVTQASNFIRNNKVNTATPTSILKALKKDGIVYGYKFKTKQSQETIREE